MLIIQALQATHFLAMLGAGEDTRSGPDIEVAEAFLAKHAERIQERFGAPHMLQALLVDGEPDEASLESLDDLPDAALHRGMRAMVAQALVLAREVEEVFIEGEPVRPMGAINHACAFWRVHGRAIASEIMGA